MLALIGGEDRMAFSVLGHLSGAGPPGKPDSHSAIPRNDAGLPPQVVCARYSSKSSFT